MKCHPCNVSICGATGVCKQCLGTLFVTIKINCNASTIVLENIKVNVVGMPYDVIIGLPDIRRHDLTRRLRHLFVENGRRQYGVVDADGVERQDLCAVDIREERGGNSSTESSWAEMLESRYKELRAVVLPKEAVLGPTPEAEPDEWLPGEECDLLTAVSESEQSTLMGDALADWPTPEDAALPVIDGDSEEAERIRALVQKFKHLFRRTVGVEPCSVPPLEIEFKPDAWKAYEESFRATAYRRQSQEKTAEVYRQINLMLSLGIIVPSSANTYSQILLAKKPNNKWRFCIDYRRLNDCIKNISWPLPNITEMVDRIGREDPKWFGVIDLTAGYHQMALHPDSQDRCSFITPFGLF